MSDVLCVGILVADLLVQPVKQLPRGGGLELVEQIALFCGGCAANTAIAIVRLGFSAGVAGAVGDDALGDFLFSELNRCGVDTLSVVRARDSGTSASAILVDTAGERSILHSYGANAVYRGPDLGAATGVRLLHIAGVGLLPSLDGELTVALLAEAKRLGFLTTMDTASDTSGRLRDKVVPCLPFLDVLLPSEAEAVALTGAADPDIQVRELLQLGARSLVIKRGPAGCTVATATTQVDLPAFSVTAVDTTGAGDCFSAGVIVGLLAGDGLIDAARLGNAVGAECVGALGATSGVRSLAAARRWLAGSPT